MRTIVIRLSLLVFGAHALNGMYTEDNRREMKLKEINRNLDKIRRRTKRRAQPEKGDLHKMRIDYIVETNAIQKTPAISRPVNITIGLTSYQAVCEVCGKTYFNKEELSLNTRLRNHYRGKHSDPSPTDEEIASQISLITFAQPSANPPKHEYDNWESYSEAPIQQ